MPIEHVVVLMLENRSFDNVFGSVIGREELEGWGNPLVPGPAEFPFRLNAMADAPRSPGHHHHHALEQLYGPPPREEKGAAKHRYTWAEVADQTPRNKGFLRSYSRVHVRAERALQALTPEFLPALHSLANAFTVCTGWHCSVPGMTQPNRVFAVCGTSYGHVDNAVSDMGDLRYRYGDGDHLYARLTGRGLSWRIYEGDFALTRFIRGIDRDNIVRQSDFFDDASTGDLPAFSFIEPRYVVRPQSQHPASNGYAPNTLARGDQLVADVYNALRANEEKWPSTLFIVTWDEHGGFADHVPPQRHPEWREAPNAHSQGFDFTLPGPRVPALVISPYARRGHRDPTERDHTTLLSTVRELFDLGGPFGRDRYVASLANVLDLPNARTDAPRRVAGAREGGYGVKGMMGGMAVPANFVEMLQTLSAEQQEIVAGMIAEARALGVPVPNEGKPVSAWTAADAEDLARRLHDA